jgi:hypothetical protein
MCCIRYDKTVFRGLRKLSFLLISLRWWNVGRSLVLGMWGENVYLILMRKREWKGRLERPKCRMKDNIKWNHLSMWNRKVRIRCIWSWMCVVFYVHWSLTKVINIIADKISFSKGALLHRIILVLGLLQKLN